MHPVAPAINAAASCAFVTARSLASFNALALSETRYSKAIIPFAPILFFTAASITFVVTSIFLTRTVIVFFAVYSPA